MGNHPRGAEANDLVVGLLVVAIVLGSILAFAFIAPPFLWFLNQWALWWKP